MEKLFQKYLKIIKKKADVGSSWIKVTGLHPATLPGSDFTSGAFVRVILHLKNSFFTEHLWKFFYFH